MFKAELLKPRKQKDKNGNFWNVEPSTRWGVINKDGYPVCFIPNHVGAPMAHLIAKLLNENRKYKIKNG